ncbi:hypothetical protein BD414DRAFT_536016 [Trametes punicea]|nr:hypothetical protein BD414DRAFT_536016 [Trametes punicea]
MSDNLINQSLENRKRLEPIKDSFNWFSLEHLKQNSPATSSDNLLLVYYDMRNSIDPSPGSPAHSDTLEAATLSHTRAQFRKFAKTAARSCAQLSRIDPSIEDVQAAYLSIIQGVAGLQEALIDLSLDDLERFDSNSVLRLPPLAMPAQKHGAVKEADTTLGNIPPGQEEHFCSSRQVESPPTCQCSVPLPLPLFPIRTTPVPLEGCDLVVPTSDPTEVEYSYTIVPSLESQVS